MLAVALAVVALQQPGQGARAWRQERQAAAAGVLDTAAAGRSQPVMTSLYAPTQAEQALAWREAAGERLLVGLSSGAAAGRCELSDGHQSQQRHDRSGLELFCEARQLLRLLRCFRPPGPLVCALQAYLLSTSAHRQCNRPPSNQPRGPRRWRASPAARLGSLAACRRSSSFYGASKGAPVSQQRERRRPSTRRRRQRCLGGTPRWTTSCPSGRSIWTQPATSSSK